MKRIVLLLLAAFGLSLSTFAQGPLTPPGAPAPTMKSLDQVEPRTAITNLPYTITASGSYYLTANLTPATNQNGIVIASDNVTIDLEGFELVGGGGGSGEGISASGAHTNIVIRNGTVRNWPGSGINLYDSASYQGFVQGIRAVGNTFTGIALRKNSRAVDCLATGNGDRGILMDADCLIEHCVSSSNLGNGIVTGPNSRLADNLCVHNGANGISAASGSLITGCMGSSNSLSGISVVGSGSTINGCTASGNTLSGISVASDGAVSGCTASGNTGGDGIVVSNNCRVVDNLCDGNAAGAGIHAKGKANRIDGNHVTSNNRAIVVDGGENLIIRNTALNSIFVFADDSHWGPIIYLAPGDDGGLSNTSGASTLHTTDPWANFNQ